MSTESQIRANRENAQHSTGPNTETGKAASCMNNFRHGFTGAFTVLASEDQEEFDFLFHGLCAEHHAKTPTEQILILKMAQHHWLSLRAQRLQDSVMQDPESTLVEKERQFLLFLRYQSTNDRAFTRALNDLLKLRAERRKAEIGFESQKQKEAAQSRRVAAETRKQEEAARRQAAETRKQELHKFALELAEAKIEYQDALTNGLETDKIIAEARIQHQSALKAANP